MRAIVRVSGVIGATTRALLIDDEGERRRALDPSILDASHGEGVPIGTLGSGHSVFGRNGFQRLSFEGAPDMGPDFEHPRLRAELAFYLREGDDTFVLQQAAVPPQRGGVACAPARPVDRVFSYAELPKAHFRFESSKLELGVVATAYSPLIAHNLESSSTPVQIFELTVQNPTSRPRRLELRLAHEQKLAVSGGAATFSWPGGELSFSSDGGEVDEAGPVVRFELAPEAVRTVRFFVAWYVPEFRTPSPANTRTYRRHYASRYPNASAVLEVAAERADDWSRAIDAWRRAFAVPPEMKRLWFSSLSSVITSTMLSDDPFFFAVESPHEWVNTMDVAVYANWVYLLNWPELEKLDLEQYFVAVPREGDQAGFVWHSLWTDAAHYSEEPTFLTRIWRAYLWLGDRSFLEESYPAALAAASYAYRQEPFEHLLTSKKGNQSYDEWMMPGASAYVNVAWLYAVYSLERMARALDRPATIAGAPAAELRSGVLSSLERRLWTDDHGGYYRCFARTPGASDASVPETIFTDQLFGRWVVAIDRDGGEVLPSARARSALLTIYENNLLEDAGSGFRGWVNGVLPGKRPDTASGYHARTCWLGAQLNLASLLGATGDEARSLDVFRSIEASLAGNHLAVGEWNRSIDGSGRAVVLEEWGKDTPRFPPYPRYTSSWEYLVRMLGLTLDETHLYLSPFRSLDFELRDVLLAGMRLWVRVQAGWSRTFVDGVEEPRAVVLRRDARSHEVEFLAQDSVAPVVSF